MFSRHVHTILLTVSRSLALMNRNKCINELNRVICLVLQDLLLRKQNKRDKEFRMLSMIKFRATELEISRSDDISLTLSTLVSGEITFGGLDHKSYWLKGKYAFIIFTKTNNLQSIQDHYLLWVVERAFSS